MRVYLFFVYLLVLGSGVFAQLNQTDAKGRKQGPWQKNYPGTTIPQYKGTFKDDQPIGKFIYNFENGQKMAEIEHGLPGGNSSVFLFYENGQLLADGFYKGELKDSLWYNYAATGELVSAENYKLGQLQGKSVYYFQQGQLYEQKLQTQKIVYYKNGKLDGAYTELHYNGKPKLKGSYLNGEKTGQWTEYHSNGVVFAKISYLHDLPHGWTTIYDQSGLVKKRTMYRDGFALTDKELKEFLARCKAQNIDPNQ